MSVNDIMKYVSKTPGNTNPAVIKSMVEADHSMEDALLSHTLSGEYRNDTAFEDLREYTFIGNFNLESVDLPNVTGCVNDRCFAYCSSLKNVNLPKVERLYDYAFNGCNLLTVLDFPNVTSVSVLAFVECPLLKAVVLRSSRGAHFRLSDVEGSTEHAFWRTPIHDGTGYFYVPREMIQPWQTACADAELTIGNQFRALEDYTVDGTVTGELDLSKI